MLAEMENVNILTDSINPEFIFLDCCQNGKFSRGKGRGPRDKSVCKGMGGVLGVFMIILPCEFNILGGGPDPPRIAVQRTMYNHVGKMKILKL